MLHALIALLIGGCLHPLNLHREGLWLMASFYIGREHAQAEYRAIYTKYERKRENAPWWCGFEPMAWSWKSFLDLMLPLLLAISAQ